MSMLEAKHLAHTSSPVNRLSCSFKDLSLHAATQASLEGFRASLGTAGAAQTPDKKCWSAMSSAPKTIPATFEKLCSLMGWL